MMAEDTLDARLSRLERRTTIWQLIAVGSALVTAGLITNACGKGAPRPPDHLELVGKNGTLTLSSDGIKLSRGDATLISLDSSGLTLRRKAAILTLSEADDATVHGDGKELIAQPGSLSVKGCRSPRDPDCTDAIVAESDLTPGAISLTGPIKAKRSTSRIEATAWLDHSELVLEQQSSDEQAPIRAHTVRLLVRDFISNVEAATLRTGPDEQISGSLTSTGDGAQVQASRTGEQKSLSVGRMK